MPIFEQNYKNWEGELKSTGIRWLPMMTVGIRQTFKKKKFIFFFVVCLLSVVVFGGMLAFKAIVPEQIKIPSPFWNINAEFFVEFLKVQTFFLYIMSVWVGANLINDDHRTNALQLYLSRPLTTNDYIFGKFAIVAFFNLIITAVPALILLLLRVLMMYDTEWIAGNFWLLFSIIGYSLLLTTISTLLILFFSSVTKNSRFSGIGYIVIMMIFSPAIAGIFYGITRNSLFAHFSIIHNIRNTLILFFGEAGKYDMDVMEKGMNPLISSGLLIMLGIFLFIIIKKKVGKTEVIQ
jgi:ABC-2 type transport system permease protein